MIDVGGTSLKILATAILRLHTGFVTQFDYSPAQNPDFAGVG